MQDSVKIGKRKFKNWRWYSSRFLEYADCGYFTLLLRPFVNKGKEMNNELLTHAYTAFVPVSVGVKVCLIKLLKRNKRLNNEQPKEHKTANERAAEQNDSWERRKYLCSKTKSEHLQWRSSHAACDYFLHEQKLARFHLAFTRDRRN